jgi:hypothetical protein
MKSIVSILVFGIVLVSGCTGINGNLSGSNKGSGGAVGPSSAPLDPALLSGNASGMSAQEVQKALTRAQKIIYGSSYIDFYATLKTPMNPGQICFTFKIETDDQSANNALQWDAYLKRAGYAPVRLFFSSYVFDPQAQYPLVYNAEACAPSAMNPMMPIYLIVHPRFKGAGDDIRLRWSLPNEM